MKADFDGIRTSLAQAYNELAGFFKDANASGLLDYIDPKDVEERLEKLRTQIQAILLLQSEPGDSFGSIADTITLEPSDLYQFSGY